MLAEMPVISRDPMQPAGCRVTHVKKETHDTWTLDVTPPDKHWRFQPGQFSMLYVFGVGELPISISGDPQHPSKQTYTVRAVGMATRRLVSLKPKDWLGVRGPFGNGWPVEQARGKDVVLVAGGIGLAPLRPVIYHILAHRADYGRLILLYGARSPRDIIYTAELKAWAKLPQTEILTTVDYGGLSWRGNVGVVTSLFRRIALNPLRTVGMICGPEIMMSYAAREFEQKGVSRHDIYLSMERNMKCGIGLCGHCQHGPNFVCKDGPVFTYSSLERWIYKREI
ncbi:MAG: FAD/NAD(P)-binding protein [Bryobacteraceae bacterium]|nr:FAD/NAD(P)-binding protein [Bryobacteraceae bacterium]MDW8379768.1 FAD/NAD(P)-binding protein [Bryobacterales bacterium]